MKKVTISVKFCTVFVLLVMASSLALAQKSHKAGEYSINYVAFNSSFLAPEVAKLYGITRGKGIAIVNVSLQQGEVITGGKPAVVSGMVSNMMQQVKYLEFKEISEGPATYYISSFKFDNKDSLTFRIEVTVPETGKKHEIKWQQKFWEE